METILMLHLPYCKLFRQCKWKLVDLLFLVPFLPCFENSGSSSRGLLLARPASWLELGWAAIYAINFTQDTAVSLVEHLHLVPQFVTPFLGGHELADAQSVAGREVEGCLG
jgi:hypothetical protein